MNINTFVDTLTEKAGNLTHKIENARTKYFNISSEDYWGFKVAGAWYSFYDNVRQSPKEYFTTNTAVISANNNLGTLTEIYIANLSPESSFEARKFSTIMTYGGLGILLTKGMDVSRKIFKIDENSSEKAYLIHDALYLFFINLPTAGGMYYLNGERSFTKLLIASVVNSFTALIAGYVNGYVKDVAKELMGIQESARTPEFLKNLSPNMKKAAFVGFTATTLGINTLMYNYLAAARTE